MTDEPVRLGIVGLGRIGRFHAANLFGRVPAVRLVEIVDADAGVAREQSRLLGGVAWSTDYRRLLEDPEIEAIVVASPTPYHAEMVEAAAVAGKHVFCEKPISLDLGRTYQTLDAVREAGILLQVGLHRRFDPDYRAAWQRIVAGDIGDVYLFRTSLRDMRPPPLEFLKGSGGFFADVTLHDFDTARWLVGEVEEVTAVGAVLAEPRLAEMGDVDNAVVVLRFVSGALGVLDNSRSAGYGYECSSEIMGSKGTLRIENNRRVSVQSLVPGEVRQDFVHDFVERFADAYRIEMEHFARAVRQGTDPEVGGADAAAAFVIAEAAKRSHLERRTVRLSATSKDGGVFYEEVG
ncbi:MAG: inositol 2-dehydrogenase [Streptosporangiales bacterium]|nr:inositol 2-dehydrogenase [Streptosporangiales bacterium]